MDTKTLYTRVAETLRAARDKMNDNGKHWTTGALAAPAEEDLGIMRYCAIGGMNAALDLPQVYAEKYRLARRGESFINWDPLSDSYEEYDLQDSLDKLDVLDAAKLLLADTIRDDNERQDPDMATYSDIQKAESAIIDFNDDHTTMVAVDPDDPYSTYERSDEAVAESWESVSAMFTRAAEAADQIAAAA